MLAPLVNVPGKQFGDSNPRGNAGVKSAHHSSGGGRDMTLEGKVALVTGASRGIGEYVAKELAAAGAAVAVAARSEEVTDPRLPGTIHTVAAAIRAAGGKATGVRIDMRDPESITAAVARTVE